MDSVFSFNKYIFSIFQIRNAVTRQNTVQIQRVNTWQSAKEGGVEQSTSVYKTSG